MKQLLICAGVIPGRHCYPVRSAKARRPSPPDETATATIAGHVITIDYNSPRVKGREGHIFTKDGLISHNPHYPVWRAGANAATTLHTDADLKIGDLMGAQGNISLFADISDPDQWDLIVNKKTGEWGLAYDASQDLGRVKWDEDEQAGCDG